MIKAELQETGDWYLTWDNEPTATATVHSYATDLDKERAVLIVRAVNNHQALLEALQRIQNSCQEMLDGGDCDPYDMAEAIRDGAAEAIAKAKGEQ